MADTRPSCSTKKKRCFFKIMLGNFQKKLRIPDAFINDFSEELSEKVVLEGPSGNRWPVKLHKTKNGTYLKDGWVTFLRDHSLTFVEVLVFKYNVDMSFKVLVLGVNACERADAFYVKPSQGLTFGQGREYQSLRGDKGTIVSSPKPERLAEEAELPITPRVPFFICKMNVSSLRKPFIVTIPAKFAKEHLPRKAALLWLRDENKNTWKMNLRVRESQNTIYGGWRKFAEDNHLMVGDSCVFKLVGETVFTVDIHRC